MADDGHYSGNYENNEIDEELEEFSFLAAAHAALFPSTSSRIQRQPRDKSFRGNEIVHQCFINDAICKEMTRMNSACLKELIWIFTQRYHASSRGCTISLEENLVMTLNYLAHAGSMGRVGGVFDHSKHTMSRTFSKMLGLLSRLFVDEVRPVDQNIVHHKLRDNPIKTAFHGCIGSIDGTHIGISPPSGDTNVWIGKPGDPTTNVLAICDHDLLFNYFLAGSEGSMHDSELLRLAMADQNLHFPFPQPGKYYLVDSGYANREGFMSPYPRTRYHPHQFRDYGPENEREFFNQQHSSLRSEVERTFGIWKNKWHIVQYWGSLRGFAMNKWPAIIEATAGLHNFVRRRMNAEYLEMNEEADVQQETVSIDLNRTPPMDEEEEFQVHRTRDEIATFIYQYR